MSSGFQEPLFDINDPTGKRVWLTTWGGLWLCEDISQANPHWERKEARIGSNSIAQNPLNPDEIFTNNDGGGTFRSNDGGQTWIQLGSFTPSGRLMYNGLGDLFLFVSYYPSNQIYRYNRSTGVFDYFFNVTANSSSDAKQKITDIDFDRDNLIYISLSNGKILKSQTQYGGPWINISPISNSASSNFTGLAISRNEFGNKVFWAINIRPNSFEPADNIVWAKKSLDCGVSWTDVILPINGDGSRFSSLGWRLDLSFNYGSDSEIILSGGNQILISSNGGVSWKKVSNQTYDKDIWLSPGGSALLVNFISIRYLANLFNTSYPYLQSKESDIITPSISSVHFSDAENPDLLFLNGSVFTGDGILSPGNTYNSTQGAFFDIDEPNLVVSLAPAVGWSDTLLIQDSKGRLMNKHKLDRKVPAILGYESVGNSLYSIIDASSLYDYTRLYRTSKVGSGEEESNIYTLNQYIHYQSSVVPVNDSLVYIYGAFLNGSLYKVSLKKDGLGIVEEVKNFTNGNPSRVVVGRENPNVIIVMHSASLYVSLDAGESWSEPLNQDIAYSFTNVGSDLDKLFYTSNEKVYFTNNFLSLNPSWEVITSTELEKLGAWGGLRYRESDGLLFMASSYKGVYSTDYFKGLVSPELAIIRNFQKDTLCFNEKVTIPFVQSNCAGPFKLILSPLHGNVSDIIFGESTQSPVSGIIPDTLVNGRYRLKIVSGNFEKQVKSSLYIKGDSSIFHNGYPRVINPGNTSFVMKFRSKKEAKVAYILKVKGSSKPTHLDFNQVKDSIEMNFQGLVQLKKDSITNVLISGLQRNTEYVIYFASIDPNCLCQSIINSKEIKTTGNLISLCRPYYYYPCDNNTLISSMSISGPGLQNPAEVKTFDSGCTGFKTQNENVPTVQAGGTYTLNVKTGYLAQLKQEKALGVWIDFNGDDQIYDNQVFAGKLSSWSSDIVINIPDQISPGLRRARVRMVDGSAFSYNMAICGSTSYGETIDFMVNVRSGKNDTLLHVTDSTYYSCQNVNLLTNVPLSQSFELELSSAHGDFNGSTLLTAEEVSGNRFAFQLPLNTPIGDQYRVNLRSTTLNLTTPSFRVDFQNYQDLQKSPSGGREVVDKNYIDSKAEITNTARTAYKAWNSIILQPDFMASPSSGGAFKAEIVGCEN
ncbi:hypothetical protein AFM12_06775 [Jiulongibacter sediminis]|uniref:GEVED domain-containing protein n=2 Tax=Jiulongibacter sediminis TaxID=1605367 RepID=A0A0P7C512_9BACT|nr:hypothetical protein AFM12_06775 [Jiulongibacter sediminis]TBX24882.1 hypothetical protein TK44_06780 [Jiulongibacter sediminis]